MKEGTGAIKDTLDLRDYKFIARGAFDWKEGYDVEKEVGKLVTKDQNGSYSCGGQAWAYYGEVLEAIATGTYEPRSAKWIYSHTRAPGGGSDGRTNCHFVKTRGFCLEKHVSSYQNGKPPKEEHFIQQGILVTKEAEENRQLSKALSYLDVATDFETIAAAIKENHGVVLGISGSDNGTWRSTYPKPPKEAEWRHWVYAGKVRLKNGKKQIGIKNSWGDIGEDGWQWLSEDYQPFIWQCWTLAWDYEPAKKIAILKATVAALQKLVELYTALRKLRPNSAIIK